MFFIYIYSEKNVIRFHTIFEYLISKRGIYQTCFSKNIFLNVSQLNMACKWLTVFLSDLKYNATRYDKSEVIGIG